VISRIRDGKTAERAVFEAFGEFQRQLQGLGGYLGERATDLVDVSQRAIARLLGVAMPEVPTSDAPFVLVARDLAPADTALLDFTKVMALITSEGGPTSHTAIIARAKSIPAIVGVAGAQELEDGTLVVVDAGASSVTVDASSADVDEARVRRNAWLEQRNAPISHGQLIDGHKIPLLANLGDPDEAADAVVFGAEGVGLFRTEFLFLDAHRAPTIEDQETAFVHLLEQFPDQKVVVRVLDAGADKPLSFLNAGREENPALGLRGLRTLRAHERILRDQIQALVNAQNRTAAELWVMAPMVADADESQYFVELAKSMGLRNVGVMAEIPSLALVAEQVFASADFVSIGTNDLTQYTLAADRTLGSVASYQDPWHPAVLRLIEMIGNAGYAAGKPVGVCGEAAADPELAVVLVGLGATTLSMAPSAFADVRVALGTVTLEEARNRASRALKARSALEARALASGSIALD
jgi:phosphotransferase system enzyme I (PtsI)